MGYYTTVRYLSGLTWSNINDIILNGKCLVEYNENSVCLYVCVCAQAHRYRYIPLEKCVYDICTCRKVINGLSKDQK